MAAAETERVRSFIAVDLEAPVLAALGRVLREFVGIKCDVRWVRVEGVHVTLKFLGWVEAPRLAQVREALGAATEGQPALHAQVHGLGAFPSLRRARVLWVGVDAPGLAGLAARVDAAMTRLGFEAEARGFTAHVTVGRVNGRRGWSHVEEVFKTHLTDDFGESGVKAVTIYRSTLRPDGAVYTPLWTIPLGRHKEVALA